MVSVEVIEFPPEGVTHAGLKLQVASEGKPLHVNLTGELNPLAGVTVSVAVPVLPAVMVRVDEFTATW